MCIIRLNGETEQQKNKAVPKSTAEKKQLLRKQCKQKIVNFTPDYNYNASEKIYNTIINLPQYNKSKTVFCFVGAKNEIQTEKILLRVLNDKKILCVPLCTDVKNGVMQARQITDLAQLKTGAFNIKEPPLSSSVVKSNEIDIAILPCLAASKIGERLGYGGGYYDRYFTNKHANTLKIVVCRNEMLMDETVIPTNEYDVFADIVLTEEHVYYID